eukprot:CAMPEP_0183588504 /NCGR_PEP_ID=MMETSP0371-20130417/160911_1 /TAXON_ID=268820 /ORGANISM="Peridinium aciculiferum, Strain PAER-2" /LENGTH=57 /DNA_ID=CAMNT_0025799765 /DNA_START=53 /DNA_END=224 /DNA_ORIENTATION=+
MSSVLQAEQKCGTASSSNPKWGRRRLAQALHLICIKFTMSANGNPGSAWSAIDLRAQ